MLRKLLIGAAGTLFSVSLTVLFLSTVLTTTLRPNNIKAWLSGSGLYTAIPDNLIKEMQKQQPEGSTSFAATNPIVVQAAKETITPSFIQTSTETVIDGSFNWVDGKTQQPNFNIDVASAKQTFADKIVAALKQRYESLPSCGRSLPATADPFAIECRPIINFDIDAQLARLKAEIVSDEGFLGTQNLNANTLTTQADGATKPIFEQYKQVPEQYQTLKRLPLIAGISALVLGLVIVFVSSDRLRGLRKVGVALIISGGFAAVSLWLINFGVTQAKTQATKDSGANAYQESILKIADAAQHDFASRGVWIIAAYLIIGIGLVVGVVVYKRKTAAPATTMPPPSL